MLIIPICCSKPTLWILVLLQWAIGSAKFNAQCFVSRVDFLPVLQPVCASCLASRHYDKLKGKHSSYPLYLVLPKDLICVHQDSTLTSCATANGSQPWTSTTFFASNPGKCRDKLAFPTKATLPTCNPCLPLAIGKRRWICWCHLSCREKKQQESKRPHRHWLRVCCFFKTGCVLVVK